MGNVPNDALGQGIVGWDDSFARPVVDLERLASDIRPHDDSPKQARRSATNGAAHWHTGKHRAILARSLLWFDV